MSFVAVLHNLRTNQNVGSIFRTAEAAGGKKIYLAGYTPGPLDKWGRVNTELAKVSLGAEKYVSWEHAGSTLKILQILKSQGYQILAVEQSRQSVPVDKVRVAKKGKYALVLGNEIRGLPHSILGACDKIIEIPMLGQKESLNVAVAFGIVMFQLIK